MKEQLPPGSVQTILKVSKQIQLLDFLFESFPDRSKNSVKSILEQKKISIDGQLITRFDFELNPGMQVIILKKPGIAPNSASLHGIKILFEDEDIIVIEKPSGLLSIATERERDLTAYSILSNYVKSTQQRAMIFIVHRLDRDTSGVMMFAKSKEIQQELQNNWDEAVSMRRYFAVAEGRFDRKEGEIISWLKENKGMFVYSSRTPGDGQKAITLYRVIKSSAHYTLLELELETGRKNQIRVHLQDIGHSVAGDDKYGAETDPIRRLALHAGLLEFIHPVTGERMRFESPIPSLFYKCLN